MRCPICYEGVMLEWSAGSYCSRRYAPEEPCGFEAGLCSSTAEWDAAVERYRASLEPPTSPDGAGASCSPQARAAGFPPGWSPARWAQGLYYRSEGIEPDERAAACKACGSPRLQQSDTSDHPGVVRCDACGLVQA